MKQQNKTHAAPAEKEMSPEVRRALDRSTGQERQPLDRVERFTLGWTFRYGLVVVTAVMDGIADALQLVEGKTTSPAVTLEPPEILKVSGKPGSAENPNNRSESELQKAHRLASQYMSDLPPLRERTFVRRGENPWLGAVTGCPGAYLWVEQENGNLVVYTKTISDNPRGVAPLIAELRPPVTGKSSWTDQVLDDAGKPTGKHATITKDVLVLKK